MMGNECINCGMLPFACGCVPWCFKHDRKDPCKTCEVERSAITEMRELLELAMVPWSKAIFEWLAGK